MNVSSRSKPLTSPPSLHHHRASLPVCHDWKQVFGPEGNGIDEEGRGMKHREKEGFQKNPRKKKEKKEKKERKERKERKEKKRREKGTDSFYHLEKNSLPFQETYHHTPSPSTFSLCLLFFFSSREKNFKPFRFPQHRKGQK